MYSCWKCHNDRCIVDTATLAGGYVARLCSSCRNAWAEYCNTLIAYTNLCTSEAAMNASICAGEENHAITLTRIFLTNKNLLYTLAKEWCPAPLPAAQPQMPPITPGEKT